MAGGEEEGRRERERRRDASFLEPDSLPTMMLLQMCSVRSRMSRNLHFPKSNPSAVMETLKTPENKGREVNLDDLKLGQSPV